MGVVLPYIITTETTKYWGRVFNVLYTDKYQKLLTQVNCSLCARSFLNMFFSSNKTLADEYEKCDFETKFLHIICGIWMCFNIYW